MSSVCVCVCKRVHPRRQRLHSGIRSLNVSGCLTLSLLMYGPTCVAQSSILSGRVPSIWVQPAGPAASPLLVPVNKKPAHVFPLIALSLSDQEVTNAHTSPPKRVSSSSLTDQTMASALDNTDCEYFLAFLLRIVSCNIRRVITSFMIRGQALWLHLGCTSLSTT